ncbi:MAG: hypothetical protein MK081_04325 [Flavobacteriales bacterium]|nr:hypothetical protein [Flavobacteriales bacterium]
MLSEDGDNGRLQRPVYLNMHSGGLYGYSNFEVNQCFGSFERLSGHCIRFSDADYTEACCHRRRNELDESASVDVALHTMNPTHLTFTGEVIYFIVFHNYLEDPDTQLGFMTIKMVRVQD